MSLYVDRDISTNFSGDLMLDQKGDLAIADSLATYKSVANFLLRTDYGDYAPNTQVGSNLGSFIGALNTRSTHEHMEHSIIRGLVEDVFSTTDIDADVLPLDINEAICFVRIAGQYLISGEIVSVDQDTLSYSFPYIDGAPTPLTI